MKSQPIIYGKTDLPEDQVLNLTYKLSGPTAVKFHACDDEFRCIVGPVGMGKSSICVWELFFRAAKQKPNQYGVRKSKWAIIRNTYPDLLNTTIQDFASWFPLKQYPDKGYSLTINYSKPITAKMFVRLPAGYNDYPKETSIDAEFLFLAIDTDDDVDKLKSYSCTGAWINEACQISKFMFVNVRERTGRFPHKKDGVPCTWSGVWMDTNPPSQDSWIPELFEKERPRGYTIFHQPPAILELPKENPRDASVYVPNMGQGEFAPAENVDNHSKGYDYWLSKTVGSTRGYIRTMLMGFYGLVSDGKTVYTEFVDEYHVSKTDIEPYRGLPIVCALDYGLSPACVLAQITPRGQLVYLDELICGLSEYELKGKESFGRYFGDTGIRNFANNVLKPYLANKYGGMEVIYTGDPSGSQRSQTDESTVIEELERCGLSVSQARTNKFIARKEAVEGFMLKRDGLKVSPRCIMLIEGFQKHYKYRKVKKPDGEGYTTEPEKNIWSHVHDAAQYAALYLEDGGRGVGSVIGGGGRPQRRDVVPSSYGSYI